MKIVFLGTSHGVPAADRYCSSTMIEVGDKRYIFDGGAPVIDLLLRRGMTSADVTAVFTTHFHGDHVTGLLSMIELASWYFKTSAFPIYLTEQRGIDGVTAYLSALTSGNFDSTRLPIRLVEPGLVYDDGSLRVTAIPTKHLLGGARPSYAYLLEAEGKSVVLSGDLSQKLKEEDFPFPPDGRELDLFVCEMAHFGVEEALPYYRLLKTKRLSVNHIHPLHKIDDLKALGGTLPYPIHIAEDGDSVTV